jgi:hypothetical protein
MNKKYLLLASQNSTLNKKELEAQALPYTFTSNGHRVRNYRIYGAEDGVGDLDNDTGKYVIPVTIGETYTNIYLPYPLYQIDGSADYIDFRNQKQYLKNRFIELSSSLNWSLQSINDYGIANFGITMSDLANTSASVICNNFQRQISSIANTKTEGISVSNGMAMVYLYIRISSSTASTVEEFKEWLDDNPTYVVYQLLQSYDINLSLPAIPTLNGINVIDVETSVQPSKLYVQGNISSFDVSSWASVQQLVRAGLHDKYFAVGDQLVCQKGGSDLTWDIIGFDHDTPADQQLTHSMTLQLHDCLTSTMQYDAPEALYYAENGLAAGIYNFTIQDDYDTEHGGGKTYQFTLSNDVPVGGQLTFGWSLNAQAADSKITSYASASSTTPIEQVSVIEGNSGTSLGTTDGSSTNFNNIYRVRFGSDNYAQSAVRQFLNSDSAEDSVWTPKNIYDRPPTWNADTAGFMSDLDSDFLAVIGAVHKVTCLNTVTDGGGSVTLDDKFFLLSRSEVFGGKEVKSVDEGEPYPYYSDYSDLSAAGADDDSNRIKYISNTAQIWYLRTPVASSTYRPRYVSEVGHIRFLRASNSHGIVPTCNII